MNVTASVGLPLFEMGFISSLVFEGLCNQKTKFTWELLILEDISDDMSNVWVYKDRLKDAGCVDIKYSTLNDWTPLGHKWVELCEMASDSLVFLMINGDDYPRPGLIEDTCNLIGDCDYYDEQQGYFYSFPLKKTILYNPTYTHKCRLNNAYKTLLFKQLKDNDTRVHCQKFIFNSLMPKKTYRNFNLYDDGVFTDGFNKISDRNEFYIKENQIFEFVDLDIREKIPYLKELCEMNFI